MKTGSLRERCEILTRTTRPDGKGQTIKEFVKIEDLRGNWRQAGGRDFLLSGAEMNIRQGTLLTRFFPKAKEDMYIKIKGVTEDLDEIYNVVTFNHEDNYKSTLWTLSLFAG